MTVKIDKEEPNVFPLVEGIDVRGRRPQRGGHLRDQSRRPIDTSHYQAELRTGQRISSPFGAVSEGLAPKNSGACLGCDGSPAALAEVAGRLEQNRRPGCRIFSPSICPTGFELIYLIGMS